MHEAFEAAKTTTNEDEYNSDRSLGSVFPQASASGLHADFLDETTAATTSRDTAASAVQLVVCDTVYWPQKKKKKAVTVETLHSGGSTISRMWNEMRQRTKGFAVRKICGHCSISSYCRQARNLWPWIAGAAEHFLSLRKQSTSEPSRTNIRALPDG